MTTCRRAVRIANMELDAGLVYDLLLDDDRLHLLCVMRSPCGVQHVNKNMLQDKDKTLMRKVPS